MFRILSFCVLLASLIGIACMTLDYVDPPVTDPLAFGFIKSDGYLPVGDTVSRVDLYAPVSKLLAEDRHAYKSILWLSGAALISAISLFISEGDHAMSPNQSPEPTPIGHRRSAIAVHVANTAWLSFFR